jgi:hypothetical protein
MDATPEHRRSQRVRWFIPAVTVAGLAVLSATRAFGLWGADPIAMDPPGYVEESAASGIDHVYDGDFSYFVGGGVAVFDCNDDFKPDLYIAGGANPAALYQNESPAGGPLRFSQIESLVTDHPSVVGVYPIDIDSDGEVDLAVLRYGENLLLRGLGGCRFERANELWGLYGGDAWTTAFGAKWEPDETLPTLAFGNYLKVGDSDDNARVCAENDLFRPDGPVYGPRVALAPGWCTLSILFSDWDRSGNADLRITNDQQYYRDGEEQLWRIDASGPPRLYTVDDGWPRLQINGMGIATYDVTGDGFPEFYLTNMGDNKFLTLAEDASEPLFYDIAFGSGVTAHRPFIGDDLLPSTAWHAEFQDVNSDGFIDLFITKGNVDEMPDFATEDPDNLLIGQPDGTFVESAVAAGLVSTSRSRGAALADFNLDGMLDVVEVNRRDAVKLWRNVGWGTATNPQQMGHWLAVQLEQSGPNRDGVGSWIEVKVGDRTLWREVTIGGGHASGQLGWIHIGLGKRARVEVRVQWPDGEIGPWIEVEADRFVLIERGAVSGRVELIP